MQAIILAAGMGKRLKELTKDVTKCMVQVNGSTLIERALSQLDRLHLSRVVIVVGLSREETGGVCPDAWHQHSHRVRREPGV
ncbi:MAG: NTP transferase domain-containing protein [Sphaerochaeta sp.]|nr:NTP transferase domain-containing protein [Sphaerochaeta sp.]MCH3919263.1 NTP transferase domain-containing protein [Sphaerochaeta sp.]